MPSQSSDSPKSKPGRKPASGGSTKISPQLHRKTLMTVLRHWLDTDPANQLQTIRSNKEIIGMLQAEVKAGKEPLRYKSKAGNSVQILPEDLHIVLQAILDEVGVTILIGKGEDASMAPFEDRMQQLKEHYHLKELHVPEPHNGIYPGIYAMYREAAACFNKVIEEHVDVFPGTPEGPRVAIGGGQTLFGMMDYIGPPPQGRFTLQTLNYATRLSDRDMYDSVYLALAANRLCRQSTVHVMNLPPLHTDDAEAAAQWHSTLYRLSNDIRRHFRDSLNPDIVFVGTGHFHHRSPSISRFYHNLGISYDELKSHKPVGDINLCYFDEGGNDLTPQILESHIFKHHPSLENQLHHGSFFKDEELSHPFLLGLNIRRLKQLVEDGKKVIVVAGGDSNKTEAIHTLLKHRIVNGLVTDAETMGRLLSKLPGARKR